jgi:hypothetical protein
MFNWFKKLLDAYAKMTTVEKPKKPTIYKIGNKKYIRVKRIGRGNKGRTGPYQK